MSLKCGIIGLPNVGKSTLFNALSSSAIAEAANYPFCTIEPNNAVAEVPDERLRKLAALAGSQKIIPAWVEFVDIAGLVKGASEGEGLGNKFLSHIREVDAIAHVVRCFEDPDVTHVYGSVDPIRDIEIINTELILADLESAQKRLPALEKKLKSGDKSLSTQIGIIKEAEKFLSEGKPVRELAAAYGAGEINSLGFLSAKPVLYICNLLESEASYGNAYSSSVAKEALKEGAEAVLVSSKIESEISILNSEEEKSDFLKAIGLEESGLSKVIRGAYKLLGLESFFTIGPKEARAWTFRKGTKAPGAAGIIHTDFEKGFIRAEVISYEDYINLKGEAGAREAGRFRLEGKDYFMRDGDVVHFRFNV